MARGPRKSVDEKIQAKQNVINALLVRVESEKRELEELYEEKKRKELEQVNSLIEETGLEPSEVAALLQQYLGERTITA